MELRRKKGVKGIKIVEHNKKLLWIIFVLTVLLVAIIFSIIRLEKEKSAKTANPASVYCEENQGILEIKEQEERQYRICKFKDGSECEELAYFRGECKKGESLLNNSCSNDADCTPASCCHSVSCVNINNKPDCLESICTKECVSGTLDCGGTCKCLNNICIAILA